MKFFFSLLTIVLIISSGIPVSAQIVLAPGEESTLTNFAASGGEAGNNGNLTFQLNSTYDTGAKILKSQVIATASVGTGEAYSLIYYDFQVSETPETHNNVVMGMINYDVFWKGYQEILATLASNSLVNVEFILKDVTTNELVKHEIVHDFDLKTYKYKIITAGIDFNDTGTLINTLPVILRRGHNYRLHLKLTTTVLETSPNAVVNYCDYMDGLAGGGEGRVELTNLLVKIGLDDIETSQKLAKMDSLENRIDTLQYKLDHHYHIYLTGRGVGQNNTEANTTLSFFEENGGYVDSSPPVYNDLPKQSAAGDINENNSVPDKFSLGQNYPNPFNPSTKISFAIPVQEHVTIRVFDILGRQVEELMNEVKSPGYYNVNFNGVNLPSGVYIYEIRAGDFVQTKKMTLLK